jgi:hypothetical protein
MTKLEKLEKILFYGSIEFYPLFPSQKSAEAEFKNYRFKPRSRQTFEEFSKPFPKFEVTDQRCKNLGFFINSQYNRMYDKKGNLLN